MVFSFSWKVEIQYRYVKQALVFSRLLSELEFTRGVGTYAAAIQSIIPKIPTYVL